MTNYRIIEIPEEITLTLKDIATALRRSEDEVWFGDDTLPYMIQRLLTTI